MTNAASWEPTNGLILYDALFPHISYGFRGRILPIATYHVSMNMICDMCISFCTNFC